MNKEIFGYQPKPKTTKKTLNGEQKRKPSLLFIVIIILTLIVIATIGYLYLNRNQINKDMQLQEQQIIKLQAQLQQVALQQRQLTTQLQQQYVSHKDWLLVDTLYSLQQAQAQLQLYAAVPETITMLQKLVNRIEQANNYQLNILAMALRQDIKTLKALKLTSVHKLQQQFVNLAQDINALKLNQTYPSKQNEVRSQSHGGWQKALYQSWHTLRQVLVVTRTENTFTPLLQQQQLLSFKQYLQSLAQQAFWSALHHDNASYHQSLRQIQQALEQYLPANDRRSQSVKARLVQLQQETFAVVLPQQLSALKVAWQLQTHSASVVEEQAK